MPPQELVAPQIGIVTGLAKVQEKTALLPDYGFKTHTTEQPAAAPKSESVEGTGKTVSGLVGGAFTLLLAGLLGFALKHRKKKIEPDK